MDVIVGTHGNRKTLVLVTAFLALVVQFFRRRRQTTPRKSPTGCPQADGNFFLGIVPAYTKAAAQWKHHEFLAELHKKLGRTWYTWCLGQRCVITTDPKNVKHILKDNFNNYPKGWPLQFMFTQLLGKGIFNADGQNWLHQRKTTSQMFTANLFKEHIWNCVRHNAKKTRDILQSADEDKAVDIFNLMNRFTLDTIGEIGFGKSIGSLEDPSSPFLKSFDKAQQITFARFISPMWPLHRLLGTGSERGTHEHFGRLDDYSRSVVRELQVALTRDAKNGVAWADIEARKSFLGLFLEDAKKRGEELHEDYLRDLVLNFLIAGRDTTAQALSWTFYCLATHPEVETKAREEIVDVCDGALPSYEDMNRLPYVQAVISEALRLFPSVPNDLKFVENDDTWPDGTTIPAGCVVVYNIYAMGRDKGIWGDDAEAFRPERWTEMTEAPDMYDYPVFNAGPRECLGKRLAQVEMKACLATLLPRVSFKLAVPPDQIKPDAQLTIGMSSGLPMFVKSIPQEDQASNASTAAHSAYTNSFEKDAEVS